MAKKRFGDRKEGRRLRSIDPMMAVAPYIMKTRSGSSNMISDSIDIENIEKYIHKKRQEGLKGFGMLNVLITAYVRTVAQRPGVNRFVSGQRIYARNEITVAFVIKKELRLDAPETVVKVVLKPDDTAQQIYEKIKQAVDENRKEGDNSAFDSAARFFRYIPGLLLKFVMFILNLMDYFDLLPKSLIKLSPFHCSLFITSMGSLGIPPVFHHLYEFGNVPMFCSYGAKRNVVVLNKDGSVEERKYIDYTVNTDDRICDGHYYASVMKMIKEYLKNPDRLDEVPEIKEDVE